VVEEMEHVLENFIVALRKAEVRVSISESIDAARALDIVGYQDKDVLKTSLGAVLAKTPYEKEIFGTCFDTFFSFDNFPDHDMDHAFDSGENVQSDMSPLTMMLILGNQADIMTSMMEGSQAAELFNMKYFIQKKPLAWKVLKYMGMDGLDRDIKELSQGGNLSSQQQAEALRDAKDYLTEYVRSFIDRHYELYTREARDNITEVQLKNLKLSSIEERDFHQMHTIIKKMVKRLNDVHSRRKRNFRRGQLDFKKTLRKNIVYQGPLFEIMWKRRKIDRPNVVVICDVSRSVRLVVRFFLLFLYSLNETIIKIRSFIFCNNLIEVSDIFDEYPVDEAVERLQTGTGLDIGLSRTDYGQALRDFKENWIDTVTKKTTVIILGDGRNNYFEPETDILKRIREKAKRLIWLNPETLSFWATGDSDMKRYGPLCDLVRECNTLSHLERVVGDIL